MGQCHLDRELHRTDPASPASLERAGRSEQPYPLTSPVSGLQIWHGSISGTLTELTR
ncbi:hypothetical protein GA0115234_100680 [Streptomyces sp. DvalAA-43]|nr:hypothetical protein GA0115234_100680 [Streptomyces sp. DvalAA-43]